MNLGAYINELLFRYDCVIVPGFGGFVGNYSPARIHPVQHRFYPPSKRITFNKFLQNNDGLLANLVSLYEKCSFELAMEQIRNEVRIIERELREGRKITLDSIGSFSLDAEQNLQFEPNLRSNYLLDSYGLQPFQVLPVKQSAAEEPETEKKTETAVIPIERKIELSKLVKIAAAASLFFAMVWIPLKTDILQQAGFERLFSNLFKHEPRTYQSVASSMPSISENTPYKSIETVIGDSTDFIPWTFLEENERQAGTPENVVIRPAETPTIAESSQPVSTGPYHVVGGCFEVPGNAEKLVRKLRQKGYPAILAGKQRGLHVVSYGSFANRQDAVDLLNKVKLAENNQAWLLRN